MLYHANETARRSIASVEAMQVLDSRGDPTVYAKVVLKNGACGNAMAPSGASTGIHEASEKRDGLADHHGKGVLAAVKNIQTEISGILCGMDCADIFSIDEAMIKADGTENKARLGANAMLAVSLACAKAAAAFFGTPLYTFLGGSNACVLPVPMMNVINGGLHADNNLDIQEFMIMPTGADSFSSAVKMCAEIYTELKALLRSRGLTVSVGDEGGFASELASDEEALSLLCEAAQNSGYEPDKDLKLAIDAAASEWYDEESGAYILKKSRRRMTSAELRDHFAELCRKYPLISIEDPLAEDDFEGFSDITSELSGCQIVGDDLFTTNVKRLSRGILQKSANAVLIKPNQIGTLSETLETVRLAASNGYGVIISHRSGETEDTFIADLSVALGCGQIKCGAPARSERTAKYNRLLQIEKELGRSAVYPGVGVFSRLI